MIELIPRIRVTAALCAALLLVTPLAASQFSAPDSGSDRPETVGGQGEWTLSVAIDAALVQTILDCVTDILDCLTIGPCGASPACEELRECLEDDLCRELLTDAITAVRASPQPMTGQPVPLLTQADLGRGWAETRWVDTPPEDYFSREDQAAMAAAYCATLAPPLWAHCAAATTGLIAACKGTCPDFEGYYVLSWDYFGWEDDKRETIPSDQGLENPDPDNWFTDSGRPISDMAFPYAGVDDEAIDDSRDAAYALAEMYGARFQEQPVRQSGQAHATFYLGLGSLAQIDVTAGGGCDWLPYRGTGLETDGDIDVHLYFSGCASIDQLPQIPHISWYLQFDGSAEGATVEAVIADIED